jgi:hypothetical protein
MVLQPAKNRNRKKMTKQTVKPQTYIEKRDALIDSAVRIANEKHPKEIFDGENYNDAWNQTYHKTMNRLAYEAGLVGFL